MGDRDPREPTEKALMQMIRGAAKLGGWLCYHTHDSRRSDPGFPDLVLVRPPDLLFVEVKAHNGRVSPEQQAWLEAINAAGIPAWLCRGIDSTDQLCRMLTARPD